MSKYLEGHGFDSHWGLESFSVKILIFIYLCVNLFHINSLCSWIHEPQSENWKHCQLLRGSTKSVCITLDSLVQSLYADIFVVAVMPQYYCRVNPVRKVYCGFDKKTLSQVHSSFHWYNRTHSCPFVQVLLHTSAVVRLLWNRLFCNRFVASFKGD